jgi:hypothetical protein
MSTRYVDFDAARAEAQREPVVVKAFGEEWKLGSSMPAEIPIMSARWASEDRGDLTEGEQMLLISKLVPEDVLTQWFARGLTVDDLDVLVPAIINAFNAPQESEGEAEAPADGGSSS